jgi:uncharacterized NAD(P)/FAD-binding protein YdhS
MTANMAATIAIVGGGFCGTLAAIRLLTAAQRGGASLPFNSRILLIDPARAGQGLAYRPGPDCWRLNVCADKMSAFVGRPDDFLRWAQARDPQVNGSDYLPRSWYGDYLADRLELAIRRSPRWLNFERIRDRATDTCVDGDVARISLSDGRTVAADRVLLALGNSPAAGRIAGAAEDATIANAWDLNWIEKLPAYVPRVMLIGTGLTMIDMALAIIQARPDTRILAISRHGLLPRPHDDSGAPPARKSLRFNASKALSRGPLHERLRRFRSEVLASAAIGGDWRTAIQHVREAMPALWQAASSSLRRRFLRHLRAWWDVHRHRAPAVTLSRIEELRRRKRLAVAAGRLVEARRIDGGIAVSWRERGSQKLHEELVDAVVNVTGPDSDPRRAICPLVQSLVEQGLCLPDETGLGWGADADGRLLTADGRPSPLIYYAGPLLRARHWEATAVPELREHVDRTAIAIAESLATGAGSTIRRLAAPAFRRAREGTHPF